MDKRICLDLAMLHIAGFTHRDLEKFWNEGYISGTFHERIRVDGSLVFPWMTGERKMKVLKKLADINRISIEQVINEKSIQIITIYDEDYPQKLRTIKRYPFLLYVRGNLQDKKLMLGVVGSRKSTVYGKKILDSLLPSLISIDAGIISGGAFGIDSISHKITLEYGGYTISIFGCGVDIYYPFENSAIFDQILASGGALVSTFPIGTQPEPFYFPIRNEIVAGFSDGIIIPEAGIKSGTLITASLALEHGRDVFAVPGDIYRETSYGTNQLISSGQAKCVTSVTDILEEYFPSTQTYSQSIIGEKEFDSREQKDIYNAIREGYVTPDIIGQNTEYSIDTIIMTLSLLEIQGHIQLGSNGKYIIY